MRASKGVCPLGVSLSVLMWYKLMQIFSFRVVYCYIFFYSIVARIVIVVNETKYASATLLLIDQAKDYSSVLAIGP